MPPDSFSQALGQLDPASRALLDLSLRRGMRPEEIGDLLGTDPESVIVARESALEQLASLLGMEDVTELDSVRARLAELPSEAWTPQSPAEAEEEPAEDDSPSVAEADQADEQPAAEEPVAEAETAAGTAGTTEKGAAATETATPAKRKSRLPLLLALLAVAAVVLVVLLASGGGDNGGKSAAPQAGGSQPGSQAAKPQPATKKPSPSASSGPEVALAPVAGGASGVTATASLADGGKRLLLNVKGLLDPGSGSYQVWLYNSVIDAQSLGSARGRNLRMDLTLPRRASRYRSIDISREPADGNPNHSGQSVLRVQLAKLSR